MRKKDKIVSLVTSRGLIGRVSREKYTSGWLGIYDQGNVCVLVFEKGDANTFLNAGSTDEVKSGKHKDVRRQKKNMKK